MYEYQVKMVPFCDDGKASHVKGALWPSGLAGAALLVGTLCLPVPSNATNLVTLPALFGLFAAYTAYGAEPVYHQTDAPAERDTVNHALTGGTVMPQAFGGGPLVLDIGYQLLVLKAFVPTGGYGWVCAVHRWRLSFSPVEGPDADGT